MKGTILVMTLLVSSIFAGMFALANEDADTGSVDIEDVELEGIPSDEIKETLDEMETFKDSKKHKRIGFSKIWRGHGWITNGEQGRLITGFWLNYGFAKIDREVDEVEKFKVIESFGRLHIAGAGNYKLVRIKENRSVEDTDSITFEVISLNKKKHSTLDEIVRDSVGRLTLHKKEKYKKLTVWEGTLEFNEYRGEEVNEVWDVEIATSKEVVRTAKAIAAAEKAKKWGFWKRFQFWERDHPEIQKDKNKIEENESNHEDSANPVTIAKRNKILIEKETRDNLRKDRLKLNHRNA